MKNYKENTAKTLANMGLGLIVQRYQLLDDG